MKSQLSSTEATIWIAFGATLALAYIALGLLGRRDYQRLGRLSPMSVILQLLVFAVHANLSYLFVPATWPALPELSDRLILNVIGLGLLVGGLAVVLVAMIQLGLSRTIGRPEAGIERAGLYSISRNPQLVGYGLVLLGWGLLWPSWHMLGWVGTYLLIARMMVSLEEEHLERAYGEAYRGYCQTVPRYVGKRKVV